MQPSLSQIQSEIATWSEKNFGDQRSQITGEIMGSVLPLLGIAEEVGELCHAVLKRHQGIRGFHHYQTYATARDDALADILVYLCDFAARENVDLLATLQQTWERVKSRNWQQNPEGIDVK
jgi:NTP pyrophosphatase (non-canonical NTP hydrolase)